MNSIYEEIRGNSGINEIEYLEEGILFFKNSDKMKRLANKLNQKHIQLTKKNQMSEASALAILIREIEKISKEFAVVELEFRHSKGKDQKDLVKAKYAKLEKSFNELIKISNKETTKKAIMAAGVGALVVGVLAAGAFGIYSLAQAGIVDSAALNVKTRMEELQLGKETRVDPNDSNTDALKKFAQRSVGGAVLSRTIMATNKDLMAVATTAGATAAGVLSASVIAELRKIGLENKTIAATVKAIENIKASEGKTKTEKKEEK